MKIVHVIDYFQPKLGYQETFLAREHALAGHDVYVVTSDRYNPLVYAGGAARAVMGNRVIASGFFVEEGIKVWRLKTTLELPHAIFVAGLEEKIRELKPDIVINHGIVSPFAIKLARLKRKSRSFKLIYDDHMTFGLSRSKMKVLYPLFKWFFTPLILREADALVAILPDTREFMHRRYGIPPERVAIIPLGANDELFRFDGTARQQLRKELTLKDDEIVFIYTGRINPEKKIHLLIDASATLTANHQKIKVMLVGNGAPEYTTELKQKIRDRGLGNTFIWHEAVPNDQLYRFYSTADAAVWPSGPSISMREAMSCGLPIIICQDSAVDELVSYENGFNYPPEDIIQLTEYMEKLLDNNLRQEMGQRSRKLVEDRFSWKIISRQFIGLV